MNNDEDCQVEQLTRKPNQERCLCQPLTLPKANLGPVLTFPQYFLYRPFQTLVHHRHASDRQTDIEERQDDKDRRRNEGLGVWGGIVVELTNTVSINSTNISTNIETALGSAV